MDRSSVDPVLAAAAGGVIGATARWAVGAGAGPLDATTFPWPTFAVNVVGCMLIGLAARRVERGTMGWAFAVTGVLGGFTTMSAFAVELNHLADADRTGLAALYLVATLLAGLGALLIGDVLGARHQPPGQSQ